MNFTTIKQKNFDKHSKKNKGGRNQDGQKGEAGSTKKRTKCNCEARQHQLINNCLGCGRIVCVQEGVGPCVVCGLLVSYQQNAYGRQLKQNDHPASKKQTSTNMKESLEQRDKLLEYDRDYLRRTQVIDDECDYYEARNKKSTSFMQRDKNDLQNNQYNVENCQTESKTNGNSWHYYSKMKDRPIIEFNQPKLSIMNTESQNIRSIKNQFENSSKCRLQDDEYIQQQDA